MPSSQGQSDTAKDGGKKRERPNDLAERVISTGSEEPPSSSAVSTIATAPTPANSDETEEEDVEPLVKVSLTFEILKRIFKYFYDEIINIAETGLIFLFRHLISPLI